MLSQAITAKIDAVVDEVPTPTPVEVPEVIEVPDVTEAAAAADVEVPEDVADIAAAATDAMEPPTLMDKLKHFGKTVSIALFVIPCKALPLLMKGKFSDMGGIWKEEQEALAEVYEEATHLNE